MSRSLRLRRSLRRGASAIEFALTLPVMITIFSVIVEYGWYFFQQSATLGAVRDGVRYGVTIDPSSGDPDVEAISRSRTVLEGYGISCPTEGTACAVSAVIDSSSSTWDSMTVVITREYTPLLGLIPTPTTVGAQMTMLLEVQ
jgi:Flp pilus assembly protein TadG